MSKQNILENTFKKEELAYQRGRETNSKVEEKKRTEFRVASVEKNRDVKNILNQME